MPNIYEVSTAAALILIMALSWRQVEDLRRWIAALSATFSFWGLISASRFILNWWALEAPRRQVMASNIDNALQSPLASNVTAVASNELFIGISVVLIAPVLLYLLIVAAKTTIKSKLGKKKKSSSKTLSIKP